MAYELFAVRLSGPGRGDALTSMGVTASTLPEARKEALALANRDQRNIIIERESRQGWTRVEVVSPEGP